MPMFHVFFRPSFWTPAHRGVEASGEGAAARASAEPEARGPALLAVAGAGSDAVGDAADRRPD